jgi:hypothetical protein
MSGRLYTMGINGPSPSPACAVMTLNSPRPSSAAICQQTSLRSRPPSESKAPFDSGRVIAHGSVVHGSGA